MEKNDIYITGNFGDSEQTLDNNVSYWDENTVVIKAGKMKRLNDPSCRHEWEVDPTEDEEGFYGVKCKHCPVGRLIRK